VAPSVNSAAQVHRKRHPTLRNNVIVGSGAQVLGPITVGEGARVGANAVVVADVPAGVTAEGLPIGAQLVGPEASEAQLFALAAQLEAAERWPDKRPPLAVRLGKEAVNQALETSLSAGLEYERKLFYLLFASEDKREGMRAFLEKRPGKFTGR